jgi:hypothetical protein
VASVASTTSGSCRLSGTMLKKGFEAEAGSVISSAACPM